VHKGCSSLSCPAIPAESPCGTKRTIASQPRGCCFNPLLDCSDACASVVCSDAIPSCPVGLAVRYPFRDCCFNPLTDCVGTCVAYKIGVDHMHKFSDCFFPLKTNLACVSNLIHRSLLPCHVRQRTTCVSNRQDSECFRTDFKLFNYFSLKNTSSH
jgi:hypothetical protein